MKYIKKRRSPTVLRKWVQVNSGMPGVQYDTHNFPKAELKRALLTEQGSICAYTMIRITESSSHIEHLKPQSVSQAEGRVHETFDHRNVVACYPASPEPGEPIVTYGAIHRKSEWDAKNFITPVQEGCERRIRYRSDGSVAARRSNDGPANWTIGALNLGDSRLVEMRRAAIEEWGLSLSARNPISRAEAKWVLAGITRRNRDGLLAEFCVAIANAAEDYIKLLDRPGVRRRHQKRKRGK